jgi:hypothetical protein
MSGSDSDEYEDGCILGCCHIELHPEDVGNRLHSNVGQYLADYTTEHSRRQTCSD